MSYSTSLPKTGGHDGTEEPLVHMTAPTLQLCLTHRWLPLGAVIDEVTMVVHAGIATGLTISMLDGLPRAKYALHCTGFNALRDLRSGRMGC